VTRRFQALAVAKGALLRKGRSTPRATTEGELSRRPAPLPATSSKVLDLSEFRRKLLANDYVQLSQEQLRDLQNITLPLTCSGLNDLCRVQSNLPVSLKRFQELKKIFTDTDLRMLVFMGFCPKSLRLDLVKDLKKRLRFVGSWPRTFQDGKYIRLAAGAEPYTASTKTKANQLGSEAERSEAKRSGPSGKRSGPSGKRISVSGPSGQAQRSLLPAHNAKAESPPEAVAELAGLENLAVREASPIRSGPEGERLGLTSCREELTAPLPEGGTPTASTPCAKRRDRSPGGPTSAVLPPRGVRVLTERFDSLGREGAPYKLKLHSVSSEWLLRALVDPEPSSPKETDAWESRRAKAWFALRNIKDPTIQSSLLGRLDPKRVSLLAKAEFYWGKWDPCDARNSVNIDFNDGRRNSRATRATTLSGWGRVTRRVFKRRGGRSGGSDGGVGWES